jgi:hypothetical protein
MPINLNEYYYGRADRGIWGSVPVNTPTVPPSGWVGNLTDFLKQGLEVYREIEKIRKDDKPPVMTTIKPDYKPIQIVPPLSKATAAEKPITPSANTVIIREKELTKPQQIKPAQGQSGINVEFLLLMFVIFFLVLAFIKGGKR